VVVTCVCGLRELQAATLQNNKFSKPTVTESKTSVFVLSCDASSFYLRGTGISVNTMSTILACITDCQALSTVTDHSTVLMKVKRKCNLMFSLQARVKCFMSNER
jgi:hypothetical protein